MILLIKLFLAHILGDFFLQPEKWVKEKEAKKLKSPKLYVHVIIHILLTALLLWNLSLWPIIVIIGISHLIIDTLKLLIQKERTKRLLFFVDQLMHIAIIILCYYWFSVDFDLDITSILTENNLLILVSLLFLTIPVSIVMKTIFSKWNIEALTKGNESLEDAGKYIGILERLLVFMFIIFNHWEAVGFLITAKSVFRFGDLKESKHRKLTEYILIGTLISFGIAITTGIIYNYITNNYV